MKITNFKQKKLRTSNEEKIPLINVKYYIIEDYSTSKITYQQYTVNISLGIANTSPQNGRMNLSNLNSRY